MFLTHVDRKDMIVSFPVGVSGASLVLEFDMFVVALTFYKTYSLAKLARQAGIRSGIGEAILRDGEYLRFPSRQACCLSRRRAQAFCIIRR